MSASTSYSLVDLDQNIHYVPSFTLESGVVLYDVPVAYKTWGKLNEARDNVMVICHALTGSADVQDWWGPLMGRGKAFDPKRYFIFCANVLGSPYGSASPITINPRTGKPYGPEFPATTVRDDVWIHKLVLDHLNITSIATVIGGSMGGMAVLEWPLCTPAGYVRSIVPIATCARHSAWCIAWGEAQRQAIYGDEEFKDGWYEHGKQPKAGLAAARMAAMLMYRSRDSFETRFGRKKQVVGAKKEVKKEKEVKESPLTPPPSPPTNRRISQRAPPKMFRQRTAEEIFAAQSYLRYQGAKFLARFDANCYIHITFKMDTHDIARGRLSDSCSSSSEVLAQIPPSLVMGVRSDGLFTPAEQEEIARGIPNAELVMLDSDDGHDGFLLEFEQLNYHIVEFLENLYPGMYESAAEDEEVVEEEGFEMQKTSVFGEAEADDIGVAEREVEERLQVYGCERYLEPQVLPTAVPAAAGVA